MLVPERLERFQIRYVNPIVTPLTRFLPSFAQLHHRGRSSGRHYTTPVQVFRRGDHVCIALIHGKTNWTKNVLARGDAQIDMSRRTSFRVVNPRLIEQGKSDPAFTWTARLVNRHAGVLVADIAPRRESLGTRERPRSGRRDSA
ncbi:nitroreductase family deazaflavin-dependent oxidoreductase [Gordonia sp. N1V]|nr:nitroreductase family deazaflavin-dependent oxidoreductase [Gordonia sp. N1V]MDF3283904.1 nitroreductase family deazaflavin-dependent oxidoreductase [Gordonia sp. N1V]